MPPLSKVYNCNLYKSYERGNAYADKSISMQVTAEAVQAENLEKADGTLATTAEEAFAIVTTIEAYEAE